MKIAVIGAGAAGTAIANVLIKEQAVKSVSVIDRNGNLLDELEDRAESPKLRVHRVGLEKELSILSLIKGYNCVISALPYYQNYKMAQLALKAGIHYIDLGGDDKTLKEQYQLDEKARERNIFIVPGAGFAPGMVNILGLHAFESMESVDSLHLQAAALPKNPVPPLNFHLSFSPMGLVNEYLNEVTIIENGSLLRRNALDGYTTLSMTSRPELGELEAFYTSGAALVLAEHLNGKVHDFSFKSLRYSGHRNIMKAMFDLGFDSEQIIDIQASVTYKDLLVRQLRKNLPQSIEDLVIANVEATGTRNGKKIKLTYELNLDYNEDMGISAMMTCTALSAVQIAMAIGSRIPDVPGGVYVPELIVNKDEYIEFLQRNGISLNITETEVS